MKGFVLCAGKGTRFYPHTHILPKVLLPFLNLPLISYNLFLLKSLKVKSWAANIHLHPEQLRDKLQQQAEILGINTPMLSYEKKLLGSAGGLFKTQKFFLKQKNIFFISMEIVSSGQQKEKKSKKNQRSKKERTTKELRA